MRQQPLYDVKKNKNLKDLLEQSVNSYGNKVAFLVKNKAGSFEDITYKQFKDDVDALGAALVSLGLKNSFIAVMGENRYEWCVSYLSVTNHLGVVVPLDKELPISEKENLLERSQAKAIIFSDRYKNEMLVIKEKESSVEYFINMDLDEDTENFLSLKGLIEKGSKLIKDGEVDLDNYKIDEEALGVLLFTSGTTDFAKGVMLSQKNICSNIRAILKTVHVGSEDVSLSLLPLHHTYECTIGFLLIIKCGGTIAFNEGLRHIQKNFLEVKPTFLVTVPLLLENMYKKIWVKAGKKRGMVTLLKTMILFNRGLKKVGIDLSPYMFKSIHESFGGRLRLIITGAAAIKPEVLTGFNHMGFKVLQGYGLTECSPLVIGQRDDFFGKVSIGLPLPGVEVKLENQDEDGIGEIITKGDNVMIGYYKNEEATKESLKDGWFYTGDLGRIDKDGAYHLAGRLKNVIITKTGKNIFPEEIESYINRSPYVLESLVEQFAKDESGEVGIKAQIRPNLEAIKEKLQLEALSNEEDDIRNIISDVVAKMNKEMPMYKRVNTFIIRNDEFIKTTTHKIKRHIENEKMK